MSTQSQGEIVVHLVPGSPFARAVLVGLEEKRLPYRLQPMRPGDSKSEAYLRLHPFGRIPTFEHGDFRLYETQAILRYLDDVFPAPALQPKAPRRRARMNQIIGINDWYFFPKVAAGIVFHRIVGPILLKTQPDEAAIAAAMPMARLCVGEIERLLGDQPFLAGDSFTIADIMLAPQLDLFAATPEGKSLLAGTKLSAWLARMQSRPSMLATLPPEALRRAA